MIYLKTILLELNSNSHIVYHATGKIFNQFDLSKTTENIIWFTNNKSKILSRDVGAESHGYLITAEITINNPAGWNEYEKYSLTQLHSMGYDGAILPDSNDYDCFVFSPSQIKILKREKISS